MKKNFGSKPWFYPLPVLIVGTYDENGKADAMNAAWGGLYGANMVELCLSAGHKTTKNIKSQKAFTVSFADAAHVIPCDYVGIVSANNTPDKMEKAGFTVTKSEFVDAPVINELPMTLECKLVKVTEEGNIIGEIVNICADESVLDGEGKIDVSMLRPIAFEPVSNGYYVLGEKVGNAFSDGNSLK
ncbi:MAG: flavin reductase family protein [Oscillospiraceae bacterium]|nr:flavin reductase family protein [Oscillospiraceae bacterium]